MLRQIGNEDADEKDAATVSFWKSSLHGFQYMLRPKLALSTFARDEQWSSIVGGTVG